MGKRKKTVDFWARNIVDHPWRYLIFSAIFLACFVPGISKVTADFSYRIWFRTTDPLIEKFDDFESRFGNDDSIVLLVHSPSGIFDKDSIKVIERLTEKAWQIPDIIRVDSLTNYQWIHSEDGQISIENFIPKFYNAGVLEKRKKIALAHEVLPSYLINKTADVAVVFAKIRPFLKGTPDDKALFDATEKLIKEFEGHTDHEFFVNGATAINYTFREVANDDMKRMLPIVILLIIFFLLVSFRSFSAVLVPFSVIGTTIAATFGLMGYVGITFNNMISMIPTIVLAISIADTVHILVTYMQWRKKGMEQKESVYEALLKNFTPTFLTSFSTSIGFLSFAGADLIPLADMSKLAAFGTMLAWVFTLTIACPLLVLVPMRVKKEKNKSRFSVMSYENSRRLVAQLSKYSTPIVFIGIFSFIGAIYLGSLNEVNSNPYAYFSKGVSLRKANDFSISRLGGVAGPEIVIDSGKEDGIKDPVFLKKVEALQDWILQIPKVTKVISIIDIIKGMNRSLHGDDESFYRLPDDQGVVAELLFLYTMSLPQGMDLNERMTLSNDSLRLSVLSHIQESKQSIETMELIEKKAKSMGLNAWITGKIPLYQGMNGHVVNIFFKSTSMALLGISLLLVFIFRSWGVGLLSLLPNILPLGFGAALMTLLGKPIDVGTALVISVCLGIVVDDTIHFLSSYQKLRKEGKSVVESLESVMLSTGPALAVTTLILVVGFGVMALASFIPNVNFGILCALILTVALGVDLIFLPSLLIFVEKHGRKL